MHASRMNITGTGTRETASKINTSESAIVRNTVSWQDCLQRFAVASPTCGKMAGVTSSAGSVAFNALLPGKSIRPATIRNSVTFVAASKRPTAQGGNPSELRPSATPLAARDCRMHFSYQEHACNPETVVSCPEPACPKLARQRNSDNSEREYPGAAKSAAPNGVF
jgi:hypothetical protein